jgi:hypothetical protein
LALVIVNVGPELVQAPALEYEIGPAGAVAATVNCEPEAAVPGAWVVIVID